MHAAWNLAARRADPRSFFLWWAALGAMLLIGSWSIVLMIEVVPWTPTLVVLLLLSCTAEIFYFVGLGIAYRHAPVPLVYPIARSAPLLIALWMALFFGERLPVHAWSGIALSVIGVLSLSFTARGGEPARAVPWALTAALGSSVYSIANKFAVDALAGYVAVLGWASVTISAAWIGLTLQQRRRTGRWIPTVRPPTVQWLLAGIFIVNAYALVIYAMRYIPAAYAVAFTNAGVVIAGVIAIAYYGERERWRTRVGAMSLICAGLALIALR